MKPLRAACADRLQRELHQPDRAMPLKVRASSFEAFTLRHTLCCSYSKVEVSAFSSSPKFEGSPAR
ncbi:unnamed protein product, partial [Ascophyllum nodosum]